MEFNRPGPGTGCLGERSPRARETQRSGALGPGDIRPRGVATGVATADHGEAWLNSVAWFWGWRAAEELRSSELHLERQL